MRPCIIFMFSGQGSQYYQMGRELFEHNPVFRTWMLEGDEIVSGLSGISIIDQIYHDLNKKGDLFNRTLYTHPAIFMVEYALTQVVTGMGVEPDYCLGASLGGFAAAAVADIITFEEALTAVVRQAEALEASCPPGGMIAVLHSPSLYFGNSLFHENLALAAVNFPSHFVVSGAQEPLSDVQAFLQEKKITCQRLSVSHGFHSSLIDPAAAPFRNFLKSLVLREPRISFISCSSGNILPYIHQDYLWETIRMPVQFQKTIQALEEHAPYLYLDLGPSGTLAAFVKYDLGHGSHSKSMALLNPFGQDSRNLVRFKDIMSLSDEEGRKPL